MNCDSLKSLKLLHIYHTAVSWSMQSSVDCYISLCCSIWTEDALASLQTRTQTNRSFRTARAQRYSACLNLFLSFMYLPYWLSLATLGIPRYLDNHKGKSSHWCLVFGCLMTDGLSSPELTGNALRHDCLCWEKITERTLSSRSCSLNLSQCLFTFY